MHKCRPTMLVHTKGICVFSRSYSLKAISACMTLFLKRCLGTLFHRLVSRGRHTWSLVTCHLHVCNPLFWLLATWFLQMENLLPILNSRPTIIWAMLFIYFLISVAARRRFPESTKEELEGHVKLWLRTSKDRRTQLERSTAARTYASRNQETRVPDHIPETPQTPTEPRDEGPQEVRESRTYFEL